MAVASQQQDVDSVDEEGQENEEDERPCFLENQVGLLFVVVVGAGRESIMCFMSKASVASRRCRAAAERRRWRIASNKRAEVEVEAVVVLVELYVIITIVS